jgi:glycopeptide antibiotics resistance protein
MSAIGSPVYRLTFTFVWVAALLIIGLPKLAVYSGETREIWKQFWLAIASVIPLVVVFPVFVRGSLRSRILGAVLCIFPCVGLLIVLFWEHFR